MGRRAGVQGKADRDRRMLDGRCRVGPRFDVVRLSLAGARRSRAIAADPGRRFLHQLRARRDADRGASPGPGRSDRADVDGRARGPRPRHRPLRRERGGGAQRARSAAGDGRRPGAGRPQQHPPLLQHAGAAEAEHRRSLAGRRRQAGLPAQQPQEGPVQRRAVAGEVARGVEVADHHHAAVARRGFWPQGDKSFRARRLLCRRHREHPVGATKTLRRIRLRLRADRAQEPGLAMGRRRVVRRKLCIAGQPRALALHRHHAGGQTAEHRGVGNGRSLDGLSLKPCKAWNLFTNSCGFRCNKVRPAPYLPTSGAAISDCERPLSPYTGFQSVHPGANLMSRSQFSRLSFCAATIGALAIAAFAVAPSFASEDAVAIPAPAMDAPKSDGIQTVVLSGGCFWGVQGVFQHTAGVVSAVSGYTGGSKATAQYETVSTGTTGHAESVQVKYDPSKISYGKLLQIFFSVAHNPTELNFQGPDSGTQYRSAIWTTNDEQKKVADAYIAQLNAAKVFGKAIVTKVGPLQGFYAAEGYHQDYLTLHPNQPYIAYNDIPKVQNLKKLFAANYTEKPTLVGEAKVTN